MLVYLPQSPPITLESPSLCLSTQSGCFPPTRFVAVKCLKLSPSLSALSESHFNRSLAEADQLRVFAFSLSVILNLLHYSLQTLPEGGSGCKHGGKR